MKEIKAIIQPFMLSKVINALKEIEGLPGVTVDTSVRGFGKGRGSQAAVPLVDDFVEYALKAKVEVVVPDQLVEIVLDVIQKQAHTGKPGDGKIFVYNVEQVVKIRTGERGDRAI
ncbi:MAG: P-II family nitrogen regulator [Terriglobia bacterium]